jgi:hypothetical protein
MGAKPVEIHKEQISNSNIVVQLEPVTLHTFSIVDCTLHPVEEWEQSMSRGPGLDIIARNQP